MLRIIQPQASHRPDVLGSQRGKQHPHIGHLVRHLVLAENVTFDNAGRLDLSDIGHALREDSVAIVGATVAGEETDESLRTC